MNYAGGFFVRCMGNKKEPGSQIQATRVNKKFDFVFIS